MRQMWIMTVLLLAGCASSAGPGDAAGSQAVTTAASGVYTWYTTDPIKIDVLALRGATTKIINAIHATDIAALKVGCRNLKSAVVTFEADTPAPDQTVRSNFAKAMDHYSTAATECIVGNYDASGNDLIAGNRFATAATGRITQLGP